MSVSLKARRVLVVDDDVNNCSMIAEALSLEGCETKYVLSGQEALSTLQSWDPQLVLLDQDMPGMTGLETLRTIRKMKYDVDVVFVSANLSPQMVSEALEAGADDYIRKPFSFREMISRIRVRFRLRDLREDLQTANDRLFELSQRDDLTGLFNMRSMYERIDHELKRTRRNSCHVACIMMDMDYFKSVNDGHDHLFGSFVLKEVGQLLLKSTRDVDFAARYGGDEFLVVLSETHEEGVRLFTERLRSVIQSHSFRDGKDEINLTVSMGYAISSNEIETTARDLVRIADHALYAAKEQGRNRVVGFGPKEVLKRIGRRRSKNVA